MTAPERPAHERLLIEGEYLVEDVGRHTCGTGPDGHYGAHERGCGLVEVFHLGELLDLLTALAEFHAPLNRPAEVMAAIEERGRQRGVQPFRDLFSGGPDTACRTTWQADPSMPECSAASIECVEVPLDDVRAAFVEAGDSLS